MYITKVYLHGSLIYLDKIFHIYYFIFNTLQEDH